MDAQLEATYEGPEAVQRRQLSVTMTTDLFLAQFRVWIDEMRRIAEMHPGTGACTLGTAMQLWVWTLEHLQNATDADGSKLYTSARQGVTFPLADALCWILASRSLIRDILRLEALGIARGVAEEGIHGILDFYIDLSHVQAARAAGEVGRVCAELIHGYRRHPSWDRDACGKCYGPADLDELEGIMPGILGAAPKYSDVTEEGHAHPTKAGPCASMKGLETYVKLRTKLDGCMTGCRLAKDRAAEAISKVMIPEALDYPV
jgi:hypothetical protein